MNHASAPPPLPRSLRWLASLSGYLVIVTDARGLTLWVNEAFSRTTGHRLADMAGQTPGSRLQSPQTDPATKALLHDAVASGLGCAGVEILNRTRQGQPLWLRLDIVPVHDAQGRLTHFFSVQLDITAQRLEQQAWRDRLELLREAGVLGFWQRDLATGQAQWDEVCRRLWGLPEGAPPPTLDQAEQQLAGADREALRRYRRELASGATQGELSYSVRSPQGERHLRSLWRRQGPAVSGVLIDTTSEHALGAERARLLQALELAGPAAQLVFWRHELASGLVHWLPAGQHPFTVDAADRSHADEILQRVLPADRPAVRAARERACRVREVIELEYRVHDASGAVRHLLTRRLGLPGADGEVAEIIGVLIDVTAQREREIALRRLSLQQALALQALRAGCFRFDLATRRFAFDEALLRLYGLPPSAAEMPFAQWLELVHPEDRPRVQQGAAALFEAPGPAAPERFRLHGPDGRLRWIETDRVVEHDEQGRALALVGTHRDVTAEVAAQAQARALDDAQLAARTRAQLLATLAHELRTPLNAVAGFAQLLQMGPPGQVADAAVAAAARHIQAAAAMMTALIDDLGDLARADAGALAWQAAAVPVQPLLDECLAWLQHGDASALRRVQVHVATPGLALWADARRARQIVLNLLSNALKYSEAAVGLDAQGDASGVRISVRDAGPGLDAAQIERAFQPFERLGRERGAQPGSGLGLTVSRRLAQMMGGDITVHSTPGQGCVFSLQLPAAPAPQAVAGGTP